MSSGRREKLNLVRFPGHVSHTRDAVPTGFKPYCEAAYAVKGHPFGLDLTPQEKKDLTAFLKTL